MKNKKLDVLNWIDGEFVYWNDLKIHIANHNMHYSGSVFEGIRVYDGKILQLDLHLTRLFHSAKMMRLGINYSKDQVKNIIEELIRINKIKNAYIRPLIWKGGDILSIRDFAKKPDHFAIILSFLNQHEIHKNNPKKVNLKITNYKLPFYDERFVNVKSSHSYAIRSLALSEVICDKIDDCLFLDHENYIAETSSSNIFFGKANDIYTPLADRFLDGITRQTIIKLLKNNGYNVNIKRIRQEEIFSYEYAFLTGTSKGVAKIGLIDISNYIDNDSKNIVIFDDYHNVEKITNLFDEFIKQERKDEM